MDSFLLSVTRKYRNLCVKWTSMNWSFLQIAQPWSKADTLVIIVSAWIWVQSLSKNPFYLITWSTLSCREIQQISPLSRYFTFYKDLFFHIPLEKVWHEQNSHYNSYISYQFRLYIIYQNWFLFREMISFMHLILLLCTSIDAIRVQSRLEFCFGRSNKLCISRIENNPVLTQIILGVDKNCTHFHQQFNQKGLRITRLPVP